MCIRDRPLHVQDFVTSLVCIWLTAHLPICAATASLSVVMSICYGQSTIDPVMSCLWQSAVPAAATMSRPALHLELCSSWILQKSAVVLNSLGWWDPLPVHMLMTNRSNCLKKARMLQHLNFVLALQTWTCLCLSWLLIFLSKFWQIFIHSVWNHAAKCL